MIFDIIKVFLPATLAFFVGILLTPIVANYLYKFKAWKKKSGKTALDGKEAKVFNSLHQEREVSTPRLGGVIIWLSVSITTFLMWLLAQILPGDVTYELDFLSRSQTWLPLLGLLIGGIVGFLDDILEIRGGVTEKSGGLPLSKRLFVVFIVSLVGALWFYLKLDVSSIGIPYGDPLQIGFLIIPLFIFVGLILYASGIIDGIDGLAGGIFAVVFAAFSGVAFFQNQIDLSAFSAVVAGSTLAFLWFNVPPARFYMSETGTMSLTICLTMVAFTVDSLGEGHGLIALPIIAFPLFATVGANILQVLSKKFRDGKKIFRVAPIHHHFEAIGWSPEKITMRYWILSVVFAIIGMIIAMVG